MKFSKLFKALYKSSPDVQTIEDLSECTGVAKSFIERGFAGNNSFEKLDKVFDYLTSDYEVEDIMAALELIQSIRDNDRWREIKRKTTSIVIADHKGKSEQEITELVDRKIEEAKRLL